MSDQPTEKLKIEPSQSDSKRLSPDSPVPRDFKLPISEASGPGELEKKLFLAVLTNDTQKVTTLLAESPQLGWRLEDVFTQDEIDDIAEDLQLENLRRFQSKQSTTLLFLAVHYSGPEIMQLLLKAGADPNQSNDNQALPVHHALNYKKWEQAKMLFARTDHQLYKQFFEKNSDQIYKYKTGLNLALWGMLPGKNTPIPMELIDFLVNDLKEKPNSVFQIGNKSSTTLLAAVEAGDTQVLKHLLSYIPYVAHQEYAAICQLEPSDKILKAIADSGKVTATKEQAIRSLLSGLNPRLGEKSPLYKTFTGKDSLGEVKLFGLIGKFYEDEFPGYSSEENEEDDITEDETDEIRSDKKPYLAARDIDLNPPSSTSSVSTSTATSSTPTFVPSLPSQETGSFTTSSGAELNLNSFFSTSTTLLTATPQPTQAPVLADEPIADASIIKY